MSNFLEVGDEGGNFKNPSFPNELKIQAGSVINWIEIGNEKYGELSGGLLAIHIPEFNGKIKLFSISMGSYENTLCVRYLKFSYSINGKDNMYEAGEKADATTSFENGINVSISAIRSGSLINKIVFAID